MNSFKLPDLGEGLQDAEIIEWRVSEGEYVEVDQLLVVVETAKAIVEIPSPQCGKIRRLCAQAGDTVNIGQSLVEYDAPSDESVSVVGELRSASVKGDVMPEQFVVGYGSTEDEGQGVVLANHRHSKAPSANSMARSVLVAPPEIVAFATKLGLGHVLRADNYGEVTKAELAKLYEQKHHPTTSDAPAPQNTQNPSIKLTGTKKIMAQTMMKSHQHVPAVTLFDDALIGHWQQPQDITVRLMRAMVSACMEVPILNAWFDEESLSIQTFEDINIGVAVNSKEGLFVPVVRKAQTLPPVKQRAILDRLIADVTARKVKPQKLLGATISLSNFGTLSGRYATPIIVPPQVSIVGSGKIRKEAVVKDDTIQIETVLPISLSFDHRAATGADASAFLSSLIADLQKPD